jgi:hypothetical protein
MTFALSSSLDIGAAIKKMNIKSKCLPFVLARGGGGCREGRKNECNPEVM